MVRIILTYTLLLSLLVQLFSREVIVMSFAINRDYIAKNLCENRDKPQLHCDGKCYLAKQLKARQEREDKETTERVQGLPVLQLFCQERFQFSFPPMVESVLLPARFAYAQRFYAAPAARLLRPPRI